MTTNLNTLAAELADAKADLAHWERLTTAADRVKALSASFDKARAAQIKAEEAEAKAASEARFNGLSNIRVTENTGLAACSGGVLRMSWNITWTAPRFDTETMTSPPRQHSATGFNALSASVMAFLIEKHPEQIPAAIMALAPGDPAAAMEEYFTALRRGYVKGKAAA
ncbi:hypothetical protein [Sphingopyxis sp. L1A2A]|uniref:hypothetical protein n=1 Tax=Sphingopyxis sp. L1A2A TaxID=2502247 RepID=UPI0010F4F469|nr:hypothetical protein [Sphingopyxis sp. L1A2A]